MRKPDSLRALLLATVPGLQTNPETLAIYVDGGRIVGGGGATLSFEYRYTLTAVLESFGGDLDMVAVPVLAWIAEQQPELLDRPDAEPFSFRSELLDGETSDVSLSIALTEAVIVTPREGGGYGVAAVAPPPRHEFDRFDGVPCGAKLWRLFFGDDLVERSSDPAAGPPP